jgi:hypothetical protein
MKIEGVKFCCILKDGGGGDYHYIPILWVYIALLKNIPLKVPL